LAIDRLLRPAAADRTIRVRFKSGCGKSHIPDADTLIV